MLLSPALAISACCSRWASRGCCSAQRDRDLMCVELMLNAVNLTFVALAQSLGMGGQVFVFL